MEKKRSSSTQQASLKRAKSTDQNFNKISPQKSTSSLTDSKTSSGNFAETTITPENSDSRQKQATNASSIGSSSGTFMVTNTESKEIVDENAGVSKIFSVKGAASTTIGDAKKKRRSISTRSGLVIEVDQNVAEKLAK